MSAMPAGIRVVRGLALAADGVLAVALAVWCGLPLGPLVVLPLAGFVPGVLRGRAYTAAWAGFIAAFYCAGLLAEGMAQPQRRTIAWALAALAALLFVTLVLAARWTARARAVQTRSPAAIGR
ncbi:MAG: DUF2069 domain-containing protein [Gammaproteobacteria bacterium]|nr:DUF2069 domain-containing protein [Gammaproteobacteria bacterium]